MKSVARVRCMRAAWQKLVTPLTPNAVVAQWQAREGEIARKNKLAASTSQTVEPIDWDYWKEAIEAPGVVEQMEAEYNALKFPAVKPDLSEVAAIEAEMEAATKAAALGQFELKEVEKVQAKAAQLKAQGLNWDLQQWYDFMPGLEAQHKAEYEDEDYLVKDELLKFEQVDWKAASAEIAKGADPDIGEAPAQVGDLRTAEEVELVESGKWSVSRLFASQEERARIQERVEKAMTGSN